MSKIKRLLTSKGMMIGALALAVFLIAISSIGGASAALTYYSETYSSQVEMYDIGVALVENGVNVSERDYVEALANGSWNQHTGVLLANMLTNENGETESLQLGRNYKEELAVLNSGTIDTYVRVSVYKYWVDPDGNKTQAIDPSAINVNFLTGSDSLWVEDEDARTTERTVLYYTKLLKSGETSPLFADTLRIEGDIAAHITTTTEGNVTTYVYDYNGYKFVLKATVDSVQDHNAEAAILSAWGVNVTVEDQTLSLK